MPPDPHRRDHLRRLIITIRLLRNFCQLLEKLWTTLRGGVAIHLLTVASCYRNWDKLRLCGPPVARVRLYLYLLTTQDTSDITVPKPPNAPPASSQKIGRRSWVPLPSVTQSFFFFMPCSRQTKYSFMLSAKMSLTSSSLLAD